MPTFERSHTISLFRNPLTDLGQSAPYVVPPTTTRLLYENFESGTLGKFTQFGTSTVVVTNQPFSGTYSLRNNIAAAIGTNDPYTGLPRDGVHTAEIILGDHIPTVRALDVMYIKYKIRFDNAYFYSATFAQYASPKLGYFCDTSLNQITTAGFYPTVNRTKGLAAIAQQGAAPKPFPDLGSSYYGECTGCGFDYNGAWSTVELLQNKTLNYVEMSINGILFKTATGNGFDGKFYINSEFRIDAIRFWHLNSNGGDGSVDAAPEYAGGVQIDEFEVWSGDPRI